MELSENANHAFTEIIAKALNESFSPEIAEKSIEMAKHYFQQGYNHTDKDEASQVLIKLIIENMMYADFIEDMFISGFKFRITEMTEAPEVMKAKIDEVLSRTKR